MYDTLKYNSFCRKTLKYDTFCRKTLKYGTFCRKNLDYALRAKKMANLRNEPTPHFVLLCRATIPANGSAAFGNLLSSPLPQNLQILTWSEQVSICQL